MLISFQQNLVEFFHRSKINPYIANPKQNQMKKTNPTLEQLLAIKEKEAKAIEASASKLRDAIEKRDNANKPKSIMDRVRTMKDVLKIAKPDKDEMAIINYSGKSKRLTFAKHVMILSLISEVLNEGTVLTMKDQRYYPYFDVSSGFVFYYTHYDVSHSNATAASRLCFKSRELADHSGRIFIAYHKNVITAK